MSPPDTPHAPSPERIPEMRMMHARAYFRCPLKIRYAIAFLLILACSFAHAQEKSRPVDAVNIHVFWSNGCPHCKKALRFLDEMESVQPDIRVIRHEVTGKKEDMALFLAAAKHFDVAQPGVPLIVIGSQHFLGYGDDPTTGQALRATAMQCRVRGCEEISLFKANESHALSPSGEIPQKPKNEDVHPAGKSSKESALKTISLPIVGEIDVRNLSLPLLTIVLAAADGFNPCAMWVLIFLLGLLVGVENRLRRFVLGGAFVAASGIVYYLIMAAWLNTLLFFGMVIWIRIAIGVVAMCVGGWSLREFFVNPDSACTVTAAPARRAVLDRLKAFALSPSLMLALMGIILLAFAVNIVELLCSAGIPAAYTQVLALNHLPSWQYHAYIGLYVLVFMLDDLLIFTGAMLAMEVTGLGAHYSRWANLFGGVILLVVGVLIIAKPEWLM